MKIMKRTLNMISVCHSLNKHSNLMFYCMNIQTYVHINTSSALTIAICVPNQLDVYIVSIASGVCPYCS